MPSLPPTIKRTEPKRTAPRLMNRLRGYDREYYANREIVFATEVFCRICGRFGEECDHIIPISQGGSGKRDNLQLLCKLCHREKTLKEIKEKYESGN